MGFTRISNSQINSRGATTLPNQPQISAIALKEEFDAPAKQIVAPAVNNLMDELEASTSANNVGAVAPTGRTGTTVQGVINSVSTDLATLETNAGQAIADAHTHDNKALLDTYTQTEADIADAVSKKHEHSNKALLDSYTQTEADIADSVSKKHSHSNKALLDTYAQSETDLADAVSKKHAHSNKALLDTYSQSESDLADAVSKKHEHSNKSVIDDLSDDGSGHLLYDGNPIGGGSVNDAYKSVKVTSGTDDTTISASGEDTFELHAGNNVTLSVDTTSTPKKITVNSTGGGGGGSYTPGDGIDISGTTISLDYGLLVGSNLTKPVVGKDIADALDGKADTSDIPANLSDLADDTTHRTVTDTEKATWNAKVSESLLKDTVGWVGKNLIDLPISLVKSLNTDGTWSGNIYTHHNVSFECSVNDDGQITSIKVNGTASSGVWFNLRSSSSKLSVKSGNYLLNGGVSGSATDKYGMYINDGSTSIWALDTGDASVNFAADKNCDIAITVRSGKTITNEMFYPMLRKASIIDSTYEPYHKSVEDWYWENNPNAGVKNFIGSPTSVGSIFTRNANGSYTANGQPSSKTVLRYDFPTENGKKYKVSGCPDGGSSSTYKMDIWNVGSYYDSTPVEITGDGNTQTIEFAIAANYSANNIVFYPMVVDAQDTSSGFQPPAMTNRELTEAVTLKTVYNQDNITAYKQGNLAIVHFNGATPKNIADLNFSTIGIKPSVIASTFQCRCDRKTTTVEIGTNGTVLNLGYYASYGDSFTDLKSNTTSLVYGVITYVI